MKFIFKNKKKIKPKRVVIIGSSGVISKGLQQYLKKNKIKFISVGKKKSDLLKSYSSYKIKKIVKNNDAVIFISAIAPAKTKKMVSQNIKMLKNFIKGVKNKSLDSFYYISSDAVYMDSKKEITENSITRPSSWHGKMHLEREKLIKKNFKDIFCILRPTLIFGKGDTHNGYGPNRFINLSNKNKNIKLFGNGEELRDHMYIEDIVKIIIECIIKKAKGVLNLASGKVYSFNYLAKVIVRLSKSKSKILKTKRVGKMPHNGYRPFNIKSLQENFPRVKIGSLKKNLKEYILYN